MVNLFHFGFSPDLIISPDAGYWLPLMTGRRTVSLPMAYMSEKFRQPGGIDGLKALDALKGSLCSDKAMALLKEQGVTHVFLGDANGPIQAEELQNCPGFSMEYHENAVTVFRFSSPVGESGGK